jgi:hypothetical protein
MWRCTEKWKDCRKRYNLPQTKASLNLRLNGRRLRLWQTAEKIDSTAENVTDVGVSNDTRGPGRRLKADFSASC